jgi:hypothetical protein
MSQHEKSDLYKEGYLAAKAEYERDAERYRWLKTQPEWLGWEHDFRPDEIEREIDAAMAADRESA